MTVFVLGGHQTDFARNYAREGLEVSDLFADAVHGTLEDAAVDASDIETVHVGNAFGMLFNGQGHLGAMPATVEPGLWGAPAMRHEGACASGGLAMLSAMAELEAGHYNTALVIGAEQERCVPGDNAARILGAAAWVGHEGDAPYMWPEQFSLLAEEYHRRYGLDHAHLAAIAELNFRNAKANPNAQTRTWSVEEFGSDDHANPVVAGVIRRTDCSQVTDGAAGVVLANERAAQHWADAHGCGLDDVPRVLGWGHRTTCAARSPMPSDVRGSTTCSVSMASRPTTALRRRNIWPSIISVSPRPARAGRRSRRACLNVTGPCR